MASPDPRWSTKISQRELHDVTIIETLNPRIRQVGLHVRKDKSSKNVRR